MLIFKNRIDRKHINGRPACACWRECDRGKWAGTKPISPTTNSSFNTLNSTTWCHTDHFFHCDLGLKCSKRCLLENWYAAATPSLGKAEHARFYVGAGGIPPDSLVASPQIQKLADHSDVISEVPKWSKIQIFRAPPRTPLGELTTFLQTSYLMGRELAACQEPHPRCRPFGPCVYGSQTTTLYRVGNPTTDRFQM